MRKRGFTLVEVLVILAIIAALAAVLVPTISNQVRKADVGRVSSDLTNLRTGVEAFLVNVHRYPAAISQLVYPIQDTLQDLKGNTYPPGLVGRWEGPYVDRIITIGGQLQTGFGGVIDDAFVISAVDGVNYLTVRIFEIAEPEFTLIDAQIDNELGASAGRLRWFDGVAEPDSIHFYALPIN